MNPQITDALNTTLLSQLDLSKRRLQTLSWLIIGMINARTVNLSHIASQFSGPAQVASSYRRLQRFFQYVRLDGDWLAEAVIKLLKLRPPVAVGSGSNQLEDRPARCEHSDVGRHHAAGTAAVDVDYFGQAGHFECGGTDQTAAALLCPFWPFLDPAVALRP
jgi:hypothetical protein